MTSRWDNRSGVRASAGSGKTYELTGHYIRALLTGAQPAQILATTFTRKAAGEILGRVLLRLAEACESEIKLETLKSELELPDLKVDEVRAVLRRLCRGLHQVSISTLDSFFSKMLRCYRHDLDLPGGVRIMDQDAPEVGQLKREAVRRTLERGESGEILRLLDNLHRGLAKRSVAQSLLDEVSQAHELFQNTRGPEWEPDYALGTLLDGGQWRTAASGLQAAAGGPGLEKFASTIGKDLDKARLDAAEFLGGGIAKKVVEGGEMLFNRKPIPEELIELYEPLVEHAKAVLLHRNAEYTRALYQLLQLYDAEYVQLCRERKVMLFQDVPLRLSGLVENQTAHEMAHRLDSAVTHLLLDEFQDTDPRQYRILKPLAQNIHLGPRDEGLLFCVGDLKQSIYGWRGATPEIFQQIGADLQDLVWTQKNESFRSSQVVLDAVNDLFGNLTANPELEAKIPAVAAAWQRDFGDHTAMRELSGYVEVLQSEEEADPEEETESAAADSLDEPGPADGHTAFCAGTIQALTQRAAGASIGVLVRSNKAARVLITELRRIGVAASAEGGSPIVDHPAVEWVLAALRLADHPSDSAAAFAVLNSPLWQGMGLEGEAPRDFGPVSHGIRRRLARDGYSATLADWTLQLDEMCDERGRQRLAQLLELAQEFDQTPGGRPGELVALAMARSVEEPSGDLVRVMTIHKSKGLEFDIVVLPQLHAALQSPRGLVHSRNAAGEVQRVASTPNETLRALVPQLARLWEDAYHREMREALCLLYVAMTRAKRALYVMLPQPALKKDGTPRKNFSAGAIVRAGLEGRRLEGDAGSGYTSLYRHGDPAWYQSEARQGSALTPLPLTQLPLPDLTDTSSTELGLAISAPTKSEQDELTSLSGIQSDMPPRGLRQVAPSLAGRSTSRSARELLGLESSPARRRGLALHALFGALTFGTTLPPEDDLLALVRRDCRGATEMEYARWRSEFETALASPALRQLLSEPSGIRGQDYDLWVEQDFKCVLDGDLVAGRFDRVLLRMKDGCAVRAELLDWKTDSVSAEPAVLREKYGAQMRLYAAALRAMLAIEDVTCHLVLTANGTILEA